MPVIGLDYDETFTLNREAWTAAMNALRAAGFRIIGVTFRYPTEQIVDTAYHEVCEKVIYASRKSKRAAARAAGYEVAVWIDDLPAWIESGVPQHDAL